MPKRILFAAILCGLFSGCLGDNIVRMRISGGDKVVFTFFGGAGRLATLIVEDTTTDANGKVRNDHVLWQIEPKEGRFEGQWVDEIDPIEYGVVPDGYKQILPSDDKVPMQLRNGNYMARPEIISAGYRPVFFTIKDGKVLPAESQKD